VTKVPAWLVNAVLALYPAGIRRRYGPEVADLLASSATPWRDVANVAWCALLDRGGSVTVARLRPHVGRVTVLLGIPVVFSFAILMLTQVGFLLYAGLGALLGPGSSDSLYAAGRLTAVGLVAVAAVWMARQLGDTVLVPAPNVVIPAALALGSVAAVGAVPVLDGQYGAEWLAATAATVCWWPAVTLLARGGVRRARLGRTADATTLMAAGTLGMMSLCYTAYLGVLGSLGQSGWLAGSQLSLGGLPALLTVCTPFALTLLEATARRPQT
jgi:hypothetical protein